MKLYNTLGVSKDASQDEIRRAYKKLAVQNHPDKGGDENKFKEISAAYDILSDEQKRAQYNQMGDAAFENGGMQNGGAHHMNPHDIFSQMFGGIDPFGGGAHFGFNMHQQQQHNVRRNDNVHNIHISLADAFNGMRKSIKIILTKTCLKCKTMCNDCQGVGTITEMHRVAIFTQMINRPCGKCNGTGTISKAKKDCSECEGKCNYNVDIKKEIEIPKAVQHGHEIRLQGYGEQIQTPKETPGDLVLRILIDEDKNFTRNGNDLIHKLSISFLESVVGKEITIPHYAGEIKMNIDNFGVIEPNKKYILPGKGMTSGDHLIIIFSIKYPKKELSAETKKQLEELLGSLNI